MIQVDGLHKRFGGKVAVAGMSFAAPDGAITTLLGGNGSGKTTTLRMICGLVAPDSGVATVDGVNVARDQLAALARLGALHDEFGLYPRLTVREHLRFSAELHGLSGSARDAAIERAVVLFELEKIVDRRTAGFSHGERMKTALARACVHGPRNIILDEPSRGLDIFAVRMLREVLKRLRQEGACILMSSHIMAEVMELSDSVVMIAGGSVKAAGPPAEVIARAQARDLESAFVSIVGADGMGAAS